MKKEIIFKDKYNVIVPITIGMLIAALYGSGLPFGLITINIAGENISRLLNMSLLSVLCIVIIKVLYKNWVFGFSRKNFLKGLCVYGGVGLIATVLTLINGYHTYAPFDSQVSLWTILVSCILNFIGVGFIEEIIFRGVILNSFLSLFQKNKNSIYLAVIGGSVIFSLVHIVGMGSQPFYLLCAKLVWTFCGGVFISAIYLRSNNILSAIVFHAIFDMGDFFVFVSRNPVFYETFKFTLLICICLGFTGVYMLRKSKWEGINSVFLMEE